MEENGISQECKDLMSSLPKHKGWGFSDLYEYQGFWIPARLLQGVLTCQHHFQALDDDILLVTSPKCGTTWLKALVFAVVNRVKTPPMCHAHPLMTSNPHDLVPFFEFNLFVDSQVPDLSKLESPRIFSTHLPVESLSVSVHDTGSKIIYLCRDPKDAFISLWHFDNKLRPKNNDQLELEEAYEMFSKGVSVCGPFWNHVLGYWNYNLKKPNKIFFLKFEELKENPELHLKQLATFCGCPFSMEEEKNGIVGQIIKLCSFDNLSNLEVNKVGKLTSEIENSVFFRKGDVGDWVNYLTPKMIEKFDRITREKFSPFGLQF